MVSAARMAWACVVGFALCDLVPDPDDDAATKAARACQEVLRIFGGSSVDSEVPVYLELESALYANRTIVNWSNNCWYNASCIVSPASAEDIARTLAIVTSSQARFSIRSGGHDFNQNHSSIEKGVLIDLVNLNTISLSSNKDSVTVGTGARWGDVYNALNGSGVSVNGARSPEPGVGGQTISGGSGFFVNMAGATAASVIAAEVVLANASIVHATEENAGRDLLWALRGGGPNYGIVTSFTYRTLPVDRVWASMRLYGPEQAAALLQANIRYRELATQDSHSSLMLGIAPGQAFVIYFYAEPVEWPGVFAPFQGLPYTTQQFESSTLTQADLARLLHSPQYPEPGNNPVRHYVVALNHKTDNATYMESFEAYNTYAERAVASGWTISWGTQPFAATGVRASSHTPLGLEEIDQDWTHVTLQWEDPADDAAAMQLMVEGGQSLAKVADRHGTAVRYRFMNDAHDGQDCLRSYGEANFQKLLDISLRYDPDRIFQQLQLGGWLLSRE